jgi:hypothetical protein
LVAWAIFTFASGVQSTTPPHPICISDVTSPSSVRPISPTPWMSIAWPVYGKADAGRWGKLSGCATAG